MVGVGLCLFSCEKDRGFADCNACNESSLCFVRNFSPDGAALVMTVSSPEDMLGWVTVRGMNLDAKGPSRALLHTDDASFPLIFTESGKWMEVTVEVPLGSGLNCLKITKSPDTSGSFRIDWLELEIFPLVAVQGNEDEEHGGESPEG